MKLCSWKVAVCFTLVTACGMEDHRLFGKRENKGDGFLATSTSNNLTMVIDAKKPSYQISPYIYGTNMYFDTSWDGVGRKMSFGRGGGNAWTPYNWEINASNAGKDWEHYNSHYLGGGYEPGMAAGRRIAMIQSQGAKALMTIPMLDHVAGDDIGGADVGKTANFLEARFKKSLLKTTGNSLTPDLNDGAVYQSEFANWMLSKYDKSKLAFALDNEPDLWSSTHPRIHPEKATYAEVRDRSVKMATALKKLASTVEIFGPVLSGYYGLQALGGAPDAGGRFFIDFYLTEMKKASASAGMRLLDVLDLHWFPEHRGKNGIRIVDDSTATDTANARIEAPRSLWDGSFKENSWISNDVIRGPVRLIPDLRERIAANYPGTKLSISEYYYGGGNHISGAIAQADVLGIFGREGVYAASLWHLGLTDDRFIYGGFKAFRNYDGVGNSFGDTGIYATTSDNAASSVYASRDAKGQLVVVAINKTTATKVTTFNVSDSYTYKTATLYVLKGTKPDPVKAGTLKPSGTNSFKFNMPAMSVTTLVITK